MLAFSGHSSQDATALPIQPRTAENKSKHNIYSENGFHRIGDVRIVKFDTFGSQNKKMEYFYLFRLTDVSTGF